MIFHGYFVPQCSSRHPIACLTHWGRGTHIYISGSDHGLSPGQRQAIFWTNEWISLIGPVGTNLSGIFIEIKTFSLTNFYLKVLSAKVVAILSWPQCVKTKNYGRIVWQGIFVKILKDAKQISASRNLGFQYKFSHSAGSIGPSEKNAHQCHLVFMGWGPKHWAV